MDLADALHLALRDATARCRADFPDMFVRADAVKLTPGWSPWWEAECERCGDPIAPPIGVGRPRRFCSQACRQAAGKERRRNAKRPQPGGGG